jgi:AhpD family alkylhydroperoxidase
MELNDRIRELIAVGAAITANCQPCLASHAAKALSCGASPADVAAAIAIGNRVRQGAAAKMEAFAAGLPAAAAPPTGGVVLEGNGYQYLGP